VTTQGLLPETRPSTSIAHLLYTRDNAGAAASGNPDKGAHSDLLVPWEKKELKFGEEMQIEAEAAAARCERTCVGAVN
jgi:hypothetical protein